MGCVSVPSKEEFLQSIQLGMKLTKDFFKKVYGYEISYPGFSSQVITALEAAGCSHAREYYNSWVSEYETARDVELKKVAHWYRLECEKEWEKRQKGSEEGRIIQTEVELLKQKKRLLMQKSQILTGS